MARRRWAIGIDFGGTAIKAGLISPAGRVAATEVFATRQIRPQAFVELAAGMVERLCQRGAIRRVGLAGVCVGAPGPVDAERGLIHELVNVAGWQGVLLQRALERRLRLPAAVENDANLFTLGEWALGAGRGARHLLGVTLGTGVGGGLVLDGRLYRGALGLAGEVGHVVVDPRGGRCGCGARGCLEALVGTAAILRLARRAIRSSQALRRLEAGAGGGLSPALISRAARSGDGAARQVWAVVGERLGLGLAGVVNLLNPERVVIGGGVANAWRWFAPSLLRTLRERAVSSPARSARVVRSRLGIHAGILGAAVLIWGQSLMARRGGGEGVAR